MRTKVIVIVLLVAGVVVIGLWSLRPRPQNSIADGTNVTTNVGSKASGETMPPPDELSGSSTQAITTNIQQRWEQIAREQGIPLNVLTQQALIQLSNISQEIKQTVNQSIEFYGLVLDDKNVAVRDATVSFSIIEFPESHFATNVLSDANGAFTLGGVTGTVMHVHVSKDGYEENTKTNRAKFNYYMDPEAGGFRPDPNAPVIFYLQRKAVGP